MEQLSHSLALRVSVSDAADIGNGAFIIQTPAKLALPDRILPLAVRHNRQSLAKPPILLKRLARYSDYSFCTNSTDAFASLAGYVPPTIKRLIL